MAIAEIQNVVARWSEQERGNLAAWLLDSLPPHSGKDGAAEEIEEARHRREDLDSGKVRPVSADEFWASVDRDRAEWQ